MKTAQTSINDFPNIPQKHYFSIGEMSFLCKVKPHVLRYWEQEFKELNNVKRRGNRRYYNRQQILLIRQIKTLLYDQGFTILGARTQLQQEQKKVDFLRSRQIVSEVCKELEEILIFLKKP